jgi:hypothetical protein
VDVGSLLSEQKPWGDAMTLLRLFLCGRLLFIRNAITVDHVEATTLPGKLNKMTACADSSIG